MACNPLISDRFDFPRRANNRPGLPRIAYRIGRYADFREAMLRAIDAAPELQGWTHREADDPGIALLEGAAIVGDILSFYQEHYANEAYLRTAAWRESIAELVRLTGYRLAPGIGGRATLAFEVRGTSPVTIRSGLPVRIELAERPDPADFETDAEVVAWPHLGRFNLYAPRRYATRIALGATRFELAAVDGAADTASLAAFDLKPGDRWLLLPPEPAYTSSAVPIAAQQAPQVVKVKKVTRLVGRVIVDVDSPLQDAWLQPVTAFKVGRSFHHFGHSAPPKTLRNLVDGSGKVTGSAESATSFDRHVDTSHDCTATSASIALPPTLLPLDQEVSDLAVGAQVVIQARIAATSSATRHGLAVVRRIAALRSATLAFSNLNAPSTLLTLDAAIVRRDMSMSPLVDVRDVQVHEVTSPPLRLRPVSDPLRDAFASGASALRFYGTAAEARAVAGRRLHFVHADGRSADVVCTSRAADFPTPARDVARLWPLSFDRAPLPFTRADFDETEPTVSVFGNLVDASQGKSEREVALGNGDSRQSWQTFALPKAPLTYALSAAGFPPHTPRLEVRVGGRLWTRVDAFHGRGPKDEVYVVREDSEGRSFVQFGDGVTGARLPSGVKNVTAAYRTGVGARGPVKPGSTPSASERPAGFDKVSVAGIVSGGADAEDGNKARDSAPGKVQSLGRLVSLQDVETEAVAVPGVVTAAAAWDLHGGVPAVVLRVLLESGREAEFEAVRAAIVHAQRCRGPDRFALVVRQARLRWVFVDLVYARDPALRAEDVAAALRAEFGLAGDAAAERSGVFGLRARRLGEREHSSRIEGRAQNVAGVRWCRVAALGRLPASVTEPAAAALPNAPRPNAAWLPCGADELLQLAPVHLTLTESADAAAGDCE